MKRYSFKKSSKISKKECSEHFSNTIIVIYKECDNLCVFLMTPCTSFPFFNSSSRRTYKKKLFITVIKRS